LQYVYTGNVHDRAGGTTHCPGCGAALIVRDWYRILDYRLDARGQCPDCGAAPAGRFAATAGSFGPQRIPVRIGGFQAM
jgi:pyruvate formate lyase activating enzyme